MHLKSRNQEFATKGPWEGKNNAWLNTLVYPKESGKIISKSSTQGAAKEARDHTIIDRSCMFCTVWETFSHNLGLNHNLGMGFRRDFKTDLSRERAQLRDGGVTNCGQFGKISARPLSLFLSWTEFIAFVVLQMLFGKSQLLKWTWRDLCQVRFQSHWKLHHMFLTFDWEWLSLFSVKVDCWRKSIENNYEHIQMSFCSFQQWNAFNVKHDI